MAEVMTLEEVVARAQAALDGRPPPINLLREPPESITVALLDQESLRTLLSAARRLDGGVEGWAVKNGNEITDVRLDYGDAVDEAFDGDNVVPGLILPTEDEASE